MTSVIAKHSVSRLLVLFAILLAGPVRAQVTQRDTLQRPDTLPADSVVRRGVSPRGAMIRSILIPGWGQAAVGSYTRGGVFFGIRSSSYYMLFRTIGRLNESRAIERRLTGVAMDSLDALIETDTAAARLLADPEVYAAAVAAFPGMSRATGYVESRRQQRQDWVTYVLFFTLMDAVDAYVNAHLKGFPTTILSDVGRDGSLRLSVSVPWPRLPARAPPNVPELAAHRRLR